MDTLNNPFFAPARATILAGSEQVLLANKQVAEWQSAQAKVLATQTASLFDLYQTSLDATVSAAQGMSRTMLDAWLPAEHGATAKNAASAKAN